MSEGSDIFGTLSEFSDALTEVVAETHWARPTRQASLQDCPRKMTMAENAP
jgi:hypothetical protein